MVDSSCWLDYFADTESSKHFRKPIEETTGLIVPVIIIYEVFKKIILEKSESEALVCIAHMKQGMVIDLTETFALKAAKLSARLKLPMADSIIFAVAQNFNAVFYTKDPHFKNLENVAYFGK